MARAIPFRRLHGRHARTERPCSLCLAAAQPLAQRPRDTRFTPLLDALLPWLLALGFVVPLALAVDGAARLFLAGLAGGVLVGATFAWQLHRKDRAIGLAATARVRAEVGAHSDARANMLLKQFEWAVNDIATLRTKLETAEREAREHAQHAYAAERDVRRLERNAKVRDRRRAVNLVTQLPVAVADPPRALPSGPEVIDLVCELNDTGPLPWLELTSADPDNLPARVRVFEHSGNVLCVSDPAIHGAARDGGPRTATLRVPLPPDLASAIRRGDVSEYRFEALVAHRWVGVRLAQRSVLYRDKRGRVYRQA